ncbi:hypothetical protein OIDMADRAFT_156477 [Oidiodendron maius Zn]|uniref:A to I editase domain-containing protein n=1 Tax=Oidiodendron maius (strain Zn) TaxID=913774 RepID=A0A0C3CZM3_OIDMZ|nr:hypothetical protein OIDMADRAFT_156477 [Oidiodendron maius Zn]
MGASSNDIADAVLKQFDDLPKKAKPLHRGGGIREWVPLCGIVAEGRESLTCLALATGMKCLPQSKIPIAQGIVLHDWHAEILAIRSFNRFLLDECYSLASAQRENSEYIRLRSPEERTEVYFQPYALKDGISLHMYCSEAPCGDASMELTMAAQDDSTPWNVPPSAAFSSSFILDSQLLGRGYFSALGIVRRKPSRPDAPPTVSKSCSDKIALKQCTSLFSSITSVLITPSNAYLSSVILPESQCSLEGCTRAFSASGRMAKLIRTDWENGYSFKPFEIKCSSREFGFSRRQAVPTGDSLVPSNISASWTPYQLETLIGGVLQGRKQGDIRGASRVCKSRMWRTALDISALVDASQIEECLKKFRYIDVKRDSLLAERESVKEDVRHGPLEGWIRNSGGEEFYLQSEVKDHRKT